MREIDIQPQPRQLPQKPLRRVTLRDITLHHAEAATPESSALPADFNDSGYPGPGMFSGSHLPAHGLFTRLCEDLVVENLRPTRHDA